MDLKTFKFLSSNRYKIEEFKRIGVDCIYSNDNADMPEVLGNSLQVILHKSKMGGAGSIVEDSIIEVNGKEIVDIKWKYKDFLGHQAIWRTSIAVNDGENIFVFIGEANVEISNIEADPIGFEDNIMIIVDGEKHSLTALEKAGMKDSYSARSLACRSLLDFECDHFFKIELISDWNGKWQNG